MFNHSEPESREPSHVTSPASSASSSHPTFVPNYLRHPPFPHGRPASNAAPKLASPSSDDATSVDHHVITATNHTQSSSSNADHFRSATAISRLSLESGFNADCSTVTTPSQAGNAIGGDSHSREASQSYRHRNGVHDHSSHFRAPSASQLSVLPPHQHLPYPGYNPDEIVVKVRIEGHPDPDFIEVIVCCRFCLSLSLFVCLSVYLCLSVCRCQSVCRCLSVCPSFCTCQN